MRNDYRVLLAGLVTVCCVAAAGCTGPGQVVVPSSPSTKPLFTPATSVTPSAPVTTATGGSGPFGTVDVDFSFTDPELLYTVTIQKANTVWLPAVSLWGDIGTLAPAMMVGIRVAFDARATLKAGIDVDYSRLLLMDDYFMLTTSGDEAVCNEMTGKYVDQASGKKALAAIGGDVAFAFDPSSGLGEGWLMCKSLGTGESFGPSYTLHVGHLQELPYSLLSNRGTSFSIAVGP
jgi:hypothetical protein